MSASLKDLRDRIGSVKNTKKITDAMKLVAAAKVRRAQSAVLGARPFSENLVKVLYAVNSRLAGEDVEDHPLSSVRPVKSARFPNLASCPLFGLCRPDGRCTARSASCTSRARSAPSRSRTAPQLRANSLDADSRRLAMLFAPSPNRSSSSSSPETAACAAATTTSSSRRCVTTKHTQTCDLCACLKRTFAS